jgi:hypothetical protein
MQSNHNWWTDVEFHCVLIVKFCLYIGAFCALFLKRWIENVHNWNSFYFIKISRTLVASSLYALQRQSPLKTIYSFHMIFDWLKTPMALLFVSVWKALHIFLADMKHFYLKIILCALVWCKPHRRLAGWPHIVLIPIGIQQYYAVLWNNFGLIICDFGVCPACSYCKYFSYLRGLKIDAFRTEVRMFQDKYC